MGVFVQPRPGGHHMPSAPHVLRMTHRGVWRQGSDWFTTAVPGRLVEACFRTSVVTMFIVRSQAESHDFGCRAPSGAAATENDSA